MSRSEYEGVNPRILDIPEALRGADMDWDSPDSTNTKKPHRPGPLSREIPINSLYPDGNFHQEAERLTLKISRFLIPSGVALTNGMLYFLSDSYLDARNIPWIGAVSLMGAAVGYIAASMLSYEITERRFIRPSTLDR